jgi:hypothetical protein
MLEVIGRADQVVEAVLLPEPAVAAEQAVDFAGGEVVPGFALGEHRLFIRKSGQHVDVVRHDGEIGKFVAIMIEMAQARLDDPGKLGAAEHAGAVALVEMLVPTVGEDELALAGDAGAKSVKLSLPVVGGRINAMLPQQGVALGLSLLDDFLGQ